MAIPVRLEDQGNQVKITRIGQLVTAPFSYDEAKFISLAVDDQGYTFYQPLAGKQFVISTIILTADKNVATDCTVEIFESTTEDDPTVSKSILNIEMLKNSARDLIGLNLIVSEGKYLNGKTDDNNVAATIMGYYIPKI